MEIDRSEPATCSVPEAGKILGIGRDKAYEEARNGRLPLLRFGRLMRVSVPGLRRMIEAANNAGS